MQEYFIAVLGWMQVHSDLSPNLSPSGGDNPLKRLAELAIQKTETN
jgi:hypothetical protein